MLKIEVLVGVADLRLRKLVLRTLDELKELTPRDGTDRIRLRPAEHQRAPGIRRWVDSLTKAISDAVAASKKDRRIILVSDRLVHTAPGDEPIVLPGVDRIRRMFLPGAKLTGPVAKHICALVALAPGLRANPRGIDVPVDTEGLDAAGIKQALHRAARAIWLRSPSGAPRDDGVAFQIRLAQNEEEIRQCLVLRSQVYGDLGYLDDEMSAAPIEVDCYDRQALHLFVQRAGTPTIAGTARLIVPTKMQSVIMPTAVGSPIGTLQQQGTMIHRIVAASSGGFPFLLHRLERMGGRGPLPIENNSVIDKETEESLFKERNAAVELSRVIVADWARGHKLATLLIRAVIAITRSLHKANPAAHRAILLECIPAHCAMYERHGFRRCARIESHDRLLDQYAVAMRLDIEGKNPKVQAPAVAERDLAFVERNDDRQGLYGQGFLCKCDQTVCWAQGQFEFFHTEVCPLASLQPAAGGQRG